MFTSEAVPRALSRLRATHRAVKGMTHCSSPVWVRVWLVAVLIFLVGCDDPTAPRRPPELRTLTVLMILNPADSSQPALIVPAATEGVVSGLTGSVYRDGDLTARISVPDAAPADELDRCIDRYGPIVGTGGQPRCLDFRFAPEYGATYRVEIRADARQPLRATAQVPGDFRIASGAAYGDPLGTSGVEARWTSSQGAYRYLVSLAPAVPPWLNGFPYDSDQPGWFTTTTDTALQTVAPRTAAAEVVRGGGPFYLDVYAVDRALYEYLTTGTATELFPVPPVQNVEGGFGVVGAWLRRSIQVAP